MPRAQALARVEQQVARARADGATVLEGGRRAPEAGPGYFYAPTVLTDVTSDNVAPFGGMRKSGMGRELGEEGLNAFRETKHIHMDFVPERKPYWFPYRERASEIPG